MSSINSLNRQEFWKKLDRYYETNTQTTTKLREKIADIVVENNIQSVLELGCNSGGNLLYISKKSPDVKLVGVDINPNAIKYGKEVEGNEAELIEGSIYDLSKFCDKSFDLVFVCGVLMHIDTEHTKSVIKEMNRIAKDFILLVELNGSEKILRYSFGTNVYKTHVPGSIPHKFSHDYIKIINDMNLKSNIVNSSDVIDGHYGGADHFVWANLNTKSLII